jgi:hypothetical protein
MSFPAVKCAPVLVRITALTEKSPAASFSELARSAYISRVSAFIFSGRSMESVRTLPVEDFAMLLMSRGYYDMGEMRSEHNSVIAPSYGE